MSRTQNRKPKPPLVASTPCARISAAFPWAAAGRRGTPYTFRGQHSVSISQSSSLSTSGSCSWQRRRVQIDGGLTRIYKAAARSTPCVKSWHRGRFFQYVQGITEDIAKHVSGASNNKVANSFPKAGHLLHRPSRCQSESMAFETGRSRTGPPSACTTANLGLIWDFQIKLVCLWS